ncbi:MAG: CinA family protein [Desulfocapsa sp.]|nr:CinA family protein [Desulfocapsa sp.]
MGESRIDEVIKDLINDSTNPTVGILGSPAAVHIRIAAKADSREEAQALIDPVDVQIRNYFPDLVMGIDNDTLEGVVDQLLCDRGWTIAIIETVSGGKIASKMTAIQAKSYCFGSVYPLGTLDLDTIHAQPLDFSRHSLLNYTPNCSLVAVVADPAAGICEATFTHPDGQETWSLGKCGQSNVMQERIAILALEYLRRFLIKTT